MKQQRANWVVVTLLGVFTFSSAQPHSSDGFHSKRIGVSAGMGVNYHSATDIVDRINGAGLSSQRVGEFKSGVDFFGALSVPVSEDWVAKFEYVYFFASYTLASNFSVAGAEFSYRVHMPTIIAQYVFVEESSYNFKVGAGVGYHFGSYDESLPVKNFSSKGIGSLLELEGNTALGENLYAHLGLQSRWDFLGDLRDNNGNSPIPKTATSLNFFAVGVRLGMTYYF